MHDKVLFGPTDTLEINHDDSFSDYMVGYFLNVTKIFDYVQT